MLSVHNPVHHSAITCQMRKTPALFYSNGLGCTNSASSALNYFDGHLQCVITLWCNGGLFLNICMFV